MALASGGVEDESGAQVHRMASAAWSSLVSVNTLNLNALRN